MKNLLIEHVNKVGMKCTQSARCISYLAGRLLAYTSLEECGDDVVLLLKTVGRFLLSEKSVRTKLGTTTSNMQAWEAKLSGIFYDGTWGEKGVDLGVSVVASFRVVR